MFFKLNLSTLDMSAQAKLQICLKRLMVYFVKCMKLISYTGVKSRKNREASITTQINMLQFIRCDLN